MKTVAALLLWLAILPTLACAAPREWTSKVGSKIQAEIVDIVVDSVTLKKIDGKQITVAVADLSDADQAYVESRRKDFPVKRKAEVPAAVAKFQKSLESMRAVEARRLGKRIAELEAERAKGKKAKPTGGKVEAGKAPPGLEARVKKATRAAENVLQKDATRKKRDVEKEISKLDKALKQRLALIESGQPYLPRLSPKDFAVGQIGELDDDLILTLLKPGKEEALISVAFDELQCVAGFTDVAAWSHVTVHRPDKFILRSDIAGTLKEPERRGDRDPATETALRKLVFEVVERGSRGAVSDYVLVPFDMAAVNPWLKAAATRRD